ncbi:MAG: single-stranded-DNA-specific exonuclease RecJ [Rubinisphaera brasiliensis]|uniref:Single-stranded-DNA-specific exonuclease RecJ n=1 Tax=Rubinisphaera brasiliensis (strain ATCC 49424 / DSM 5305 / JCM 21570 / IAM 15109 / NBRC 103401 / IFAM 1448) TaxID=756272 RepID=F0SJT5_RUBBR|nr:MULTISPECIES: single-stranded-DNA-specific exonuclease RecJ [Rubinisphaera]ADY61923.1 exonuclease RecJ [Rubinisphaera brasiliensis DSM 5305]MBB01375.1 single-stranded-DNA-specific exonuclease RecJ [Planctomyces sp.]
MPRTWQFSSHDTGLVSTLASQMRCSTLLAQVLMSRGFRDATAAKEFVSARLSALQEPETLPGAVQAAERIVAAVQAGRRITIYGDYDVDGMTSTSILLQCLHAAGATADYYIPCRLEEGYGLNCDAIRELHQADPERLVVTVDCGIASLEEAKLAKELGLELVITDHHQFGEQLPEAEVLVHPRIVPDADCFPELCGAGVAFKLAWAICQQLGDGKRASNRMRDFLKSAVGLATIGTVADVVPLVGENRMLVKYGLQTLQQQATIGLQALMAVSGLRDKSALTSEDIGFGLAPRLNAAGRLGQARLAVELLVTTDTQRAAQLAEYLDGLNKQRQTVERKILKQAKEQVEAHESWADDPVLVIAHHDWHPGVIGIVASRVAEIYEKPTLLITLGTGHGFGQGSGRSYAGFNLHKAMLEAGHTLEKFGGHPAAVGLKIAEGNIEDFRTAINDAARKQQGGGDEELAPRLIDSEVALNELSVKAIQELDFLGPFGCQNERPIFVSTGVELAEPPRTMGEGGRHLSLQVRQFGHSMRAVAFGRGDWAEQLAACEGTLALCFKPNINEFRGRRNVELQLIDWKTDDEVFGRPSVSASGGGSKTA